MVRCDDGVMVRCDRRPAAGGCERREAVVVAAVAVVVAVVAVVVAVVAVVFFPSPQAQMDVRMLAGGLRNCGCLRSEEDEDDPSHASPLPSPHFSYSFLYCFCLAFASLLHCLCLVCISRSYHVCPAFVSLLSRFCLAFCLACVSLLSRFCLACFCPAFCLAFVSLMSRCLSRCQLPAHLRVWGEGGNGGKRRGVGRGEGCEDAEEVAKVFSGPTTGLPWQRWRFSACASLGLGRPAECLGGTPAASEPPEAEVGVLRGAVQEQGSHGSSYGERA